MNWYKKASSLGMTIGKWLEKVGPSVAGNSPNQKLESDTDISNIMSDISLAMQDDSATFVDSDMLNNALAEAEQYIRNRGQTDPFNAKQLAIVQAVRNMGTNPSMPQQDELGGTGIMPEVTNENIQMDQ